MNVALGLGVADLCSRYGRSQLAFVPSRQTQSSSWFDYQRIRMTKYVFEVWSVRRFRAWRRGLMQPIWQVVSSIRPLQCCSFVADNEPALMKSIPLVQEQVPTKHWYVPAPVRGREGYTPSRYVVRVEHVHQMSIYSGVYPQRNATS